MLHPVANMPKLIKAHHEIAYVASDAACIGSEILYGCQYCEEAYLHGKGKLQVHISSHWAVMPSGQLQQSIGSAQPHTAFIYLDSKHEL